MPPSSPAPVATADLRPAIFLNPNALAKPMVVGFVAQASLVGFEPGITTMRDTAAEALVDLLTRTNGRLICTDQPHGGYDTPIFMMNRGGDRAVFRAVWFVSPMPPSAPR